MRTTVTLDPDVEVLLKKAMRDSDRSFKQALNDSLRLALLGAARRAPAPPLSAAGLQPGIAFA